MVTDSESWNQISYTEWKDNVTELHPCAVFESYAGGVTARVEGVLVGTHRHDGSAWMGDDDEIPLGCGVTP